MSAVVNINTAANGDGVDLEVHDGVTVNEDGHIMHMGIGNHPPVAHHPELDFQLDPNHPSFTWDPEAPRSRSRKCDRRDTMLCYHFNLGHRDEAPAMGFQPRRARGAGRERVACRYPGRIHGGHWRMGTPLLPVPAIDADDHRYRTVDPLWALQLCGALADAAGGLETRSGPPLQQRELCLQLESSPKQGNVNCVC